METVTVQRSFAGEVEAVRSAMDDLEPFMKAAGFDGVVVDDDWIELTNNVGLLTIELSLRCFDSDAELAYEQTDGIFESMETRYTVEQAGETVTVTAVTDFELDVAVVGSILDGTVITRQRRKELTAQMDYLEAKAGKGATAESDAK